MESRLEQYWERAKRAILRLWSDEVDEADLKEPMDHDQLCHYFGEKCNLTRRQAEQRVDRIIREIESRPPGL